MTTPDSNGQLPLHTALQNNVRLGSIKLLVKGNPSALRTLENNFALPLHIACEHHESADVIQYLGGLDAPTLHAVDRDGNTALHLACCSGSYEIIALLLDKFDAVSVSKQNAYGKLPFHLLWESSDRAVLDREIEYTEIVFRLLRAYPESLMNIDERMQSCSRQSGKKRNFGKEE
jgi:ankyrin repeat protein